MYYNYISRYSFSSCEKIYNLLLQECQKWQDCQTYLGSHSVDYLQWELYPFMWKISRLSKEVVKFSIYGIPTSIAEASQPDLELMFIKVLTAQFSGAVCFWISACASSPFYLFDPNILILINTRKTTFVMYLNDFIQVK